MLTVHHLRVSQSERIVWLCEELGLHYELKCYDRDPPMSGSPPAYKALHPAGRIYNFIQVSLPLIVYSASVFILEARAESVNFSQGFFQVMAGYKCKLF